MQILHPQQGYASRDAVLPIMLSLPFAYGEGFHSYIASASPSARIHTHLFLAMASQELHSSELQNKPWENNLAPFWSNPSETRPIQQHPQSLGVLPAQTTQRLGLGLDREIQSYCSSGQVKSALDLLLQAEESREFPSETAYRSLFKACSRLNDAKKLQAHLARRKLDLSQPLGEVLVVALLKCGGLHDALEVFNALPQRTVFSWSAMLSHYADCSNSLEALRLYKCMQEEGVEPNEYTYVALFKACGSIPDLKKGIALHESARARGFESSLFVANTLVSMYGKCGRIAEAEKVFFRMLERDLVSWNAMLSAYVEQNEAENALQLYNKLLATNVNPNNRTFLFLLQACCLLAEKEKAVPVNSRLVKVSALEVAHRIHVDAQIKGFESDIFVGNALVKVYGKCGSVGEAQEVFQGLPWRDVVSWNTLLSVFVEHGRGEKALRLYRQMQEEGEAADERTFVNAVQACCSHSEKEEAFTVEGQEKRKLVSLDIGQGLHAEAKRKGFGVNIYLCNTLVAMYAKCGSLVEAENVLVGMPQRDILSWTAMLGGYMEQGKMKEALLLYNGIQEHDMRPDERTLDILLQVCCALSEGEEAALQNGMPIKEICLQIGQALHFECDSLGLCSDPLVKSSLVNFYGKCGCVAEAERIFSSSFQSRAVLWNAMLSIYNEQGEAKKALELYRQMQDEGVDPDLRTFVIALQSCCALADVDAALATETRFTATTWLEIGQSLHADARKGGFGLDPYISSALVSLYGKCGNIKKAENVFCAFPEARVMLWNALFLAYLEAGEPEKTLQLFGQMCKHGLSLDKDTCVITLQAVGVLAENEKASRWKRRFIKVSALMIGKKLHALAQGRGFDLDVFVGMTLLSMYGKCKSIKEAEAVFAQLPHRDVVSWNMMLSVYNEQGLGEQALNLYKRMHEENVIIDEITLACLLQVCSLLEDRDLSRDLHFVIVSAGCDTTVPLVTALIHVYGNCALMADAKAIFDKLSFPDTASWNALIAGYAKERNSAASLEMFEKMQEAKVWPTGLTFLSLLLACNHGGLVEEGVTFFESLSRDYGINVELEHYVTLVQLLGQAGDFQRLKNILSNVPAQPDPAFWLGLLTACQRYGNEEVEDLVLLRSQHLQSSHPKAYRMLLSMHTGKSHLKKYPADKVVDVEREA